MYNKIGIAGKFRLIHQAHIELIIKASSITNILCIFIVDSKDTKRYCSINELKKYFVQLSLRIDSHFIIHVVPQESDLLNWDRQILKLVPDIQAMIDSKEVYGNKLIKNIYMQLNSNINISVSNIEKDLYCNSNFALIEKKFRKFLSIKIFLYHPKSRENLLKIILILNKLKVYFEAEILYKINLYLKNNVTKLYNATDRVIFILLNENIDSNMKQFDNYLENSVFINLLEYDDLNDLIVHIEQLMRNKKEKIKC